MASLLRRRAVSALALAPLLPWAGGLGLLSMPLAARAAATPFQARRLLMGTWVDVTVPDAAQAGLAEATEAAFAEMARLAGMMSRFDPTSQLTALNGAAGRGPVAVPAEMMQVLVEAQRVAVLTRGAFDVTVGRLTPGPGGIGGQVPHAAALGAALRHVGTQGLTLDTRRRTARIHDAETLIDLGGIAKLPILEAGLNVFTRHGIRGVMLNGGGDVLASARADGTLWRVGVRDAAHPERLLAVLPLHAGVVASSGDYERFVPHEGRKYHHIVDPRTGRPTQGVAGVTLVARTVGQVNGLGAAAMVAGCDHGPALLRRAGVVDALMVGSDGGVWVSPALLTRLQAPWDARRSRECFETTA